MNSTTSPEFPRWRTATHLKATKKKQTKKKKQARHGHGFLHGHSKALPGSWPRPESWLVVLLVLASSRHLARARRARAKRLLVGVCRLFVLIVGITPSAKLCLRSSRNAVFGASPDPRSGRDHRPGRSRRRWRRPRRTGFARGERCSRAVSLPVSLLQGVFPDLRSSCSVVAVASSWRPSQLAPMSRPRSSTTMGVLQQRVLLERRSRATPAENAAFTLALIEGYRGGTAPGFLVTVQPFHMPTRPWGSFCGGPGGPGLSPIRLTFAPLKPRAELGFCGKDSYGLNVAAERVGGLCGLSGSRAYGPPDPRHRC